MRSTCERQSQGRVSGSKTKRWEGRKEPRETAGNLIFLSAWKQRAFYLTWL